MLDDRFGLCNRLAVGAAIGDVLPLAVGVALSPVPIIAIVLMLETPRARTNGPAFAVGWLAGLTGLGAVLLAITSGRSGDDGPATWVSVLLLVIGAVFILLAARTWRGRPRGGDRGELPDWMKAIDGFTALRSLAAGVFLSALNPKNLALTVAAVAEIAAAGISSAEEVGALIVFVLLGSATILASVAIFFALGERAERILGGIKSWMAAYSAAIMTVLLLVLGAKLIGDAISGLS